jgi:putative transcription factor
MKLPLSVLAERLAEKESFLERIEAEKTRPSIELAKKLEKELNVKLLEPAEPSSMPAIFEPSRKSSGRTLGDVVEFERKEKKK